MPEQLLSLSSDEHRGVAEAARKGLIDDAVTDPLAICEILKKVDDEAVPLQILRDLLSRPAQALRLHAAALSQLANSRSPSVRVSILGSLAAGWADPDAANAMLQHALSDENPSVRTQAARSMRLIGTDL